MAVDVEAWRSWAIENLQRGVPEQEVQQIMEQRGVLGLVLGVEEPQAASYGEGPVAVEHYLGLTSEEFHAALFQAGVPGIIDDCMLGSAMTWTPEYLAQVLGRTEVEVMRSREVDYLEMEKLRVLVPFSEYVDWVLEGSDCYMVANNPVLQSPAAEPLWRDLFPDQRFCDPRTRQGYHLWFGPQGTVTNLHYDLLNVMNVQVYGRKRWVLVPPGEPVCPTTGVYCKADVLDPELRACPEFREARRTDFTISPGEAVFVPRGWWHAVISMDTSIGVSFSSFRFPNPVLR